MKTMWALSATETSSAGAACTHWRKLPATKTEQLIFNSKIVNSKSSLPEITFAPADFL